MSDRRPAQVKERIKCILHPDHRIAYWPIFKSASTSLKEYLGVGCGFRSGLLEDFGYTQFSVVREPVSRYIAACEMVRLSKNVKFNQIFDHAMRLNRIGRFYDGEGNIHFRPQVDFLPTGLDNLTLFPIEKLSEIEAWLKERGVEPTTPFPHQRATPQEHKAYAQEVMTSADREFLREVYVHDVELYQRARDAWR